MTAVIQPVASKLFESREFFPIDVNFGDKERIRIQKRPRKGVTDIVDIHSNTNHIGMFVGIEKNGDMLKFGPAGINKSHNYRGILNFTFVKLIEYYGLKGINAIVIDVPENIEFKEFLMSLGFIMKNSRFMLEFNEERMKVFMKAFETPREIRSQVGQIEAIISANNAELKPEKVTEMTNIIVEKIKNMDPLGKKFWDNRKVAQINVTLSTALIYPDKLEKKEFLESSIKIIVASFDTANREAYLEELFLALENKKAFSMPYIQSMVEKMQKILKEEIKNLNKDHLRKWIHESMPAWKLNDKILEDTRNEIITNSKLKKTDFGGSIKDHLVQTVDSIIEHYNGTTIFFGLTNKM